MKVVLFCGGLGTRIRDYSESIPKPMIPVGNQPILWHIMQYYSQHGHRDFVLCLGYKAAVIKDFFLNAKVSAFADCVISDHGQKVEVLGEAPPDWRVTLVDTGENSMTGGRLKRVEPYLRGGGDFCFTYGDGVSSTDISKTIAFHKSHGKLATVTAVRPPARFGALRFEGDDVTGFVEKPEGEGGYINGGFFVLKPEVLDRIEGPYFREIERVTGGLGGSELQELAELLERVSAGMAPRIDP